VRVPLRARIHVAIVMCRPPWPERLAAPGSVPFPPQRLDLSVCGTQLQKGYEGAPNLRAQHSKCQGLVSPHRQRASRVRRRARARETHKTERPWHRWMNRSSFFRVLPVRPRPTVRFGRLGISVDMWTRC